MVAVTRRLQRRAAQQAKLELIEQQRAWLRALAVVLPAARMLKKYTSTTVLIWEPVVNMVSIREEKERRAKAERLQRMRAVRAIQAVYRNRISWTNTFYRIKALRRIRSFARVYGRPFLRSRRDACADVLRDSFRAFNMSIPMALIMKQYRRQVIECQRYFRSYCKVSHARIELLMLWWSRIEYDIVAGSDGAGSAFAARLRGHRQRLLAENNRRNSKLNRTTTVKKKMSGIFTTEIDPTLAGDAAVTVARSSSKANGSPRPSKLKKAQASKRKRKESTSRPKRPQNGQSSLLLSSSSSMTSSFSPSSSSPSPSMRKAVARRNMHAAVPSPFAPGRKKVPQRPEKLLKKSKGKQASLRKAIHMIRVHSLKKLDLPAPGRGKQNKLDSPMRFGRLNSGNLKRLGSSKRFARLQDEDARSVTSSRAASEALETMETLDLVSIVGAEDVGDWQKAGWGVGGGGVISRLSLERASHQNSHLFLSLSLPTD